MVVGVQRFIIVQIVVSIWYKVCAKWYWYFDKFLHGRQRILVGQIPEGSRAMRPVSLDDDGFLFESEASGQICSRILVTHSGKQ